MTKKALLAILRAALCDVAWYVSPAQEERKAIVLYTKI